LPTLSALLKSREVRSGDATIRKAINLVTQEIMDYDDFVILKVAIQKSDDK